MKILILAPTIFPDRHSGVAKLVYNVARQLGRRGHEIVVLTNQYGPDYPIRETVDGMSYHRVPIPKRGDATHALWPISTPLKSRGGQKKLREEHDHFDIVWVHNPWWILFSDPKKFWPRARIVYDFHSDASSELMQNHGNGWKIRSLGRLYDSLIRSVMKKADAVLVHSEFTRNLCFSLSSRKAASKVHLIPGAADPDIYFAADAAQKERLKKELRLPTDRPVFMTARGLKRRTGVDKLVEAAHALKKKGVSFYLNVIGDGPLQAEIADQIVRLGLTDSARLVSDLSEEDLALHYRASDVFVLPTQGAEGFGLATVEALASGLIVLGTNNSSTPEILRLYHPDWIIPGSDPERISEAMFAFCRQPERFSLSPEKIREITVRHFSWSVVADQFASMAQSLL